MAAGDVPLRRVNSFGDDSVKRHVSELFLSCNLHALMLHQWLIEYQAEGMSIASMGAENTIRRCLISAGVVLSLVIGVGACLDGRECSRDLVQLSNANFDSYDVELLTVLTP